MLAVKLVAIFATVLLSTIQATSSEEINLEGNQIRRGQDSQALRWRFHDSSQGIQSSNLDLAQGNSRRSQDPRKVPVIMPPNNQNAISTDRATSHFNSNPFHNVIEQDQYDFAKTRSQDQQSSNSVGSNTQSLLSPNLELVLRQASGDESVFQPSPTIEAIGHQSYDWASGSQSTSNAKMESAANESTQAESISKKDSHVNNSSAYLALRFAASSTTNRPGIFFNEQNDHFLNNHMEPVVLNHQQSISSHQKEYQADGNTSLEFNNQVIYEGPATPPSAASADDYYFSSSEKLPTNKEPVKDHNDEISHSNAWWALGLEGEFERVSNLTRDDYVQYCDRSPLLINNKQRSLCRMHPRVMSVIARGLRMAFDECQARFTTSRWNCSLIVSSWLPNDDLKPPSVFGQVMSRPNRERSFLNAIIAAGLAHSMTKACSQGELPEECSCDRKIKSKNNRGRVEWVACSDDIDYGARFSRDFTDNFDPYESEASSTIYIHNSEVGRRVFKSAVDITCTCLNGENGLCQTKRCWKHLGSYSDIVEELVKRYDGATHVQRSNKDPHKLRPVRRGVRKPKRKDLVFIEESPDYCQQDSRMGILGTRSRSCDSKSQGSDSCSLLCCGRGYQTVVDHIEEDCNCKFVWCCQVKCDKCKRFVTNEICN